MNKLKKAKVMPLFIFRTAWMKFFEVCDRITVLRDGKFVATENAKDTNLDTVIQHIVGSGFDKAFEWKARPYSTDTTPVLEVKKT
ncbi:hypothetical protein GCM10020331_009170 [Ectobacillus funiculus]